MPVYLPPLPTTPSVGIGWAIKDRFGIIHDMTWAEQSQVFVPKGTKGLGYAPTEIVSEKRPFARGSKVRYIRTNPVIINLPIVITKPTFEQLLAQVDVVRDWFFTGDEKGILPAYLQVTRPQDDDTRQIEFYYQGGLEGDLQDGGPTFVPYIVQLYCPDSDWLASSDTEYDYDNADLGNPQTITNPGDVDAYPIFTVNGPTRDFTIYNDTTGKRVSLTNNGGYSNTTGQSFIIDTRPPTDRDTLPVIDSDNVSLYTYVTVDSQLDLWLRPGANELRFTVTDTSGTTSVNLAFTPRYRGVLR